MNSVRELRIVPVRHRGPALVRDQVRDLVHVSSAVSGDVSTFAALANLFWWYRNGRKADRDLGARIRAERGRLRLNGVSPVDIWRVSRCLKIRRVRVDCNCPMCRSLLCKTFD